MKLRALDVKYQNVFMYGRTTRPTNRLTDTPSLTITLAMLKKKKPIDWAHSLFSPGGKDNHHDLSKSKFLSYFRRFNAYLIGERP